MKLKDKPLGDWQQIGGVGNLAAMRGPPNNISACTSRIGAAGDLASAGGDFRMWGNKYVKAAARGLMGPRCGQSTEIGIEPSSRLFVLLIDVEYDELVASRHADQRVGPALPPSGDDVGVTARVLKAVRGERGLVLVAGKDRDAPACKAKRFGLDNGIDNPHLM